MSSADATFPYAFLQSGEKQVSNSEQILPSLTLGSCE